MVRIPDYTQGIVAQRETPRMYDPYAIAAKAAPAKALADVFSIGAKIATTMKNANDMTAVNSAVIKKKRSDIEFREQFFKDRSANPMGMAKDLEAAYKERDKAILESLPSQEARQSFQREADEINLRFYENDLSHETTLSAAMFTNKASQAIDDLAVMAYRGEPLEELRKQRQATSMTLGGVLSADQIQKFDEKSERVITESYLEGLIDNDIAKAKAEIDSRKYDSVLGVDSLNRMNDNIQREVERQQKEAIQLEQKKRTLRMTDPAALADLYGADSPKARVDIQRELGITEGNISILRNEEAALVANQLNGLTSSDDMARSLQQIRNDYGDEYYNTALKDIKKAGLSSDMGFLMMMNPTRDKQVMDAMFTMAREGKDYSELARSRGVATKDITEAVEAQIADARDVRLVEGGDVVTLNRRMEDVATYFAASGIDVNDSSVMATKWLVDKTPMGSVAGKKFRVPLDYSDIDQIEDALDYELDNLKPEDVNILGLGIASTAALKRDARFVLGPTEDYYYLKWANVAVAKAGSTEVLTFPIADILEAQKVRQATAKGERKQKTFEENLLGLGEE